MSSPDCSRFPSPRLAPFGRPARRLPRRAVRLIAPVLVLAALGCREDAASPTAPGAGALEASSALAAAVATPLSFIQVTVGAGHTCGVTTDNRAYCWGRNERGTLGDGTTTNRRAPRAVAGGLRFRFVSAGPNYTCGLTTDDRAYCWGDNVYGTLGEGSNVFARLKPVAVAGGRRYRQLRTGSQHACAVTLANVALCWGDNWSGKLGIGFGSSTTVPVPVHTGGLAFRQVLAGGLHTCGLTTDNKAWCWGGNDFGQLGDGARGDGLALLPVAGGLTFAHLSLGNTHTCGVTTDDVAYCWGSNFVGTLGDGTQTTRLAPAPVAGGLRFRGVSASSSHTCGVTVGNAAYCWGHNREGQLGDGTFGERKFRTTPNRVAGQLRFAKMSGMNVSGHTCGVTTGDRAYCWGHNAFGQLGDGTLTRRTRPVAVVGKS